MRLVGYICAIVQPENLWIIDQGKGINMLFIGRVITKRGYSVVTHSREQVV